ncbi:MAG: preprotein translocase subunit SecA [Firmicutes bacterium]|nr:preprotein translocase subunit SecA [Bacillota bacterium]MBR0441392.1 preprotein translocase subunit SecA [Bacillota bacterium]
MGLFSKLFGDLNDKEIKRIEKIVARIEALDGEMQSLSNEELRAKTPYLKERLAKGETLDDILPEAFAVCREAAVRTVGMKPFHVQLIGGVVLHEGNIAEMKTGEGKTLVATLPVYLNALEGKGVHVVTVNDYLASTQSEWMGKIYTFLGLSVGCIVHGLTGEQRKAAYNADITYGTNNEFGFDYLRDNMAIYASQQLQRELNFAIVDEVDSILIDEARTPLIISGTGDKSSELYFKADKFVRTLTRGEVIKDGDPRLGGTITTTGDYTVDEKDKTVALTEEGVAKCERYFGIENFSDPDNMEINHHVLIALKAHAIMKRDVDYIEHNGEIVIVDEFTGRLMFGRRYSDGLHQAIEAKEGINVRNESRTLATITLQNYFRMYNKLAGMTGTAKTEELEFTDIYNMKVIVIPTNKPVIRDDMEDSVYTTEAGKFRAIIDDVVRRHETGQPVLVGTVSVEKSEILSEMLKKRGVPHNVLNAKQHMREAEIVAQAGRLGAVTIATNMAGRGTDILLGGNPEFEAKKEMRKLGYEEEAISAASSFIDLTDPELIAAREKYHQLLAEFSEARKGDAEKVKSLGGLHIIGSERHEARRIDNQLRGRAGRQGDPGSSQFYVALDDDLMRLFGGDRAQSMMMKMGLPDDEPLETGILTKSIESAQKKVEGRNFAARKYVLQYDDVMNRQRTIIYAERKRVLMGEDLQEHVISMMRDIASEMADAVTIDSQYPEEWDFSDLNDKLRAFSEGLKPLHYEGDSLMGLTRDKLADDILGVFEAAYAEKEKQVGSQQMRDLERMIMLYVVDQKWMDHIDAMDQLKTGIGLRSLGQQNPAQAYANEGADMFEMMVRAIREDMVKYVLRITVETRTERRQVAGGGVAQKDDVVSAADEEKARSARTSGSSRPTPGKVQLAARPQNVSTNAGAEKPKPIRVEKTPGRNDPCPCGSGKKYKNCHGRNL